MTCDLHASVEAFLYHEAALLDQRRFHEWSALFTADGLYWVPLRADQTDWRREASLFCEDSILRDVRCRRLESKVAWSQYPATRMVRCVTNIQVIARDGSRVTAESCLTVVECNARNEQRLLAGHVRHNLQVHETGISIALKCVRLVNSEAPHEGLEIFL